MGTKARAGSMGVALAASPKVDGARKVVNTVHHRKRRQTEVRRAALSLLLLVVLTGPGRAQEIGPEPVAASYLSAMQAGDWAGMAKLMHPDALHQLREFMAPLFASGIPEAEEFRQQFLGVRTAAEAAALSDTTVFTNFVRALNARNPVATQALREAIIEQIGHVTEGPDIAHVVYRATLDVEGMSVTNVSVLPLKRSGDLWRVLLTGDYSALATALRQALGG